MSCTPAETKKCNPRFIFTESVSVVSFAGKGTRVVSCGKESCGSCVKEESCGKESKRTEVESCEKTVSKHKNRQKTTAFMNFILGNIVNLD